MNNIEYIKQQISQNGQCKSLALTPTAAVAIFGTNGYAWSGDVPIGMQEDIKQIWKDGLSIDDVILKDDGSWLIIFNNYTFCCSENVPDNLCRVLRSCFEMNQKFCYKAV